MDGGEWIFEREDEIGTDINGGRLRGHAATRERETEIRKLEVTTALPQLKKTSFYMLCFV